MDTKELKKIIRREIKERKVAVSIEDRQQLSAKIQERLLEMEEVAQAGTILLYHSLPDEVDTGILLSRLSNRRGGSKRVILPAVEGEYLLLKEYIPNEMAAGYRDIAEPTGEVCIDPSEIDLAIIPGVAFDSSCNRLGRGKGFYDRLIPYLSCKKIGLGFDFQIVDNIPCEEFDRPLDMVLTQTRQFS